MKTTKQETLVKITTPNARRIKKVCKSVKLTPEFLVNDILSRLSFIISVKPKEYEI